MVDVDSDGRPNKRVGDEKDEDTTDDERRIVMPTRFGTEDFMAVFAFSLVDVWCGLFVLVHEESESEF